MEKKGLSPIIATVLLISLVVVLAAIIFMWARGFISEQIEKAGQSAEAACTGIDFDAEQTPVSSTIIKLNIVNRGNVPIYSFHIEQIKSGGDTEITEFKNAGVPAEGTTEVSVTLDPTTNEIILYPAILGNIQDSETKSPYTCLEKGLTLKIR